MSRPENQGPWVIFVDPRPSAGVQPMGTNWGYVYRRDGVVIYSDNPRDADTFPTRDEAMSHRPGHDRAMGGDGQRGYAVLRERAIANHG
jgi:hypothetical protein